MRTFNNKDSFLVVLLSLILLCTSIYLPIPNPFSVGNTAKVSVTDIGLLILSLVSFIYILKNKKFKELDFIVYCIFMIGFVVLTISRFLITKSFSVSIVITEMISFAFFFYYLVKLKIINKTVILCALLITLTFINLQGFLTIIIQNVNLRSVALMGNVNIYTSFVFITAPILLYEYQAYNNKWTKGLLYINLVLCIILFPLTGSRVASVALILLLLVVYVLLYSKLKLKFHFKMIGKIVLIFIVSILSLTFLFNSNVAIKKDIGRTFSFIIKVPGLDEIEEDKENKDTIMNGNRDEYAVIESTPNLRRDLINRALLLIKDNPMIGSGRPTIFVNKVGEFTVHNYILEVFLNYGLLVGVLYFALALIPLYSILRNLLKKKKMQQTLIFAAGYAVVFLYSMVEPILSTKIVVLLPLWSYAVFIRKDADCIEEK